MNDEENIAQQAAPSTVEVEIARDWWDGEGVRHPAGTKVSVPIEAAMEGLENGALRRPRAG